MNEPSEEEIKAAARAIRPEAWAAVEAGNPTEYDKWEVEANLTQARAALPAANAIRDARIRAEAAAEERKRLEELADSEARSCDDGPFTEAEMYAVRDWLKGDNHDR